MNELKRHGKYNSEKLWFLKLQNKFFDRLRNRGFRIYYLTKVFASVSYSSRNKYLFTSDKIYSNVVQETQAEAAITEVGEAIFDNHFNTSNQDRSKEVEDLRETIKDGKTPTTDKVVPFGKLPGLKSKKSNIDFSLGFVLPGECYELKKDIQNIFDEEYRKASTSSSSFQQCFNNTKIGALFRNEKKIGDLISKSKL